MARRRPTQMFQWLYALGSVHEITDFNPAEHVIQTTGHMVISLLHIT